MGGVYRGLSTLGITLRPALLGDLNPASRGNHKLRSQKQLDGLCHTRNRITAGRRRRAGVRQMAGYTILLQTAYHKSCMFHRKWPLWPSCASSVPV